MEARTPDLEAITARLERIAQELEAGPDDEHAAELVREASESAAEAGRAVEAARRAAANPSPRKTGQGRSPPPPGVRGWRTTWRAFGSPRFRRLRGSRTRCA